MSKIRRGGRGHKPTLPAGPPVVAAPPPPMTPTLRARTERQVDRMAQARDSVVRLRARLVTVRRERDEAREQVAQLSRELAEVRLVSLERERALLDAIERVHGPA